MGQHLAVGAVSYRRPSRGRKSFLEKRAPATPAANPRRVVAPQCGAVPSEHRIVRAERVRGEAEHQTRSSQPRGLQAGGHALGDGLLEAVDVLVAAAAIFPVRTVVHALHDARRAPRVGTPSNGEILEVAPRRVIRISHSRGRSRRLAWRVGAARAASPGSAHEPAGTTRRPGDRTASQLPVEHGQDGPSGGGCSCRGGSRVHDAVVGVGRLVGDQPTAGGAPSRAPPSSWTLPLRRHRRSWRPR